MKVENKALSSDIAIMKSAITAPDRSAEHDAQIASTKSAIKRAQKDLAKVEKELDQEHVEFEQSSLTITHVFNRIKNELKISNTSEGRKIKEIMHKLEGILPQNYEHAVGLAKNRGEKEQDKEKEIAEIYNAREKMVYTEHQLKLSRKKLSKLMSWKERLEYHEELK